MFFPEEAASYGRRAHDVEIRRIGDTFLVMSSGGKHGSSSLWREFWRSGWTMGSMPEPNHLSPSERRQVSRRGRFLRATIGLGAISLLVGSLLSTLVIETLSSTGSLSSSARLLLAAGLLLPITLITYRLGLLWIRSTVRSVILKSFRGRRAPVCLNCGHDVREIQGTKCPECGAGIVVPDR